MQAVVKPVAQSYALGRVPVPCTIVVGGQFGSEGKGKAVALIAIGATRPWVVRCGGPNSGHTVDLGGAPVVLRQVPAGVGNPESTLLMAAGCAVDETVLLREVGQLRLPKSRVIVDPRAVIISDRHREIEGPLRKAISSTASGTGAALSERLMRTNQVRLAGDSAALRNVVTIESIAPLLHDELARGGAVIVEGSQGFGLSLLHGPHFPHVTSRDTTASGFASEVGLSPRQVDSIVVVIRTYPIRVGGPSGPLPDEITWGQVALESAAPEAIPEYTSVTRTLRRVARFDIELVKSACRYNLPTSLAVMGLDRLDYENRHARRLSDLTPRSRAFLAQLSRETGVLIEWVGTGFGTNEAFHASTPTADEDGTLDTLPSSHPSFAR
jgi:adenylosuccinate synthase